MDDKTRIATESKRIKAKYEKMDKSQLVHANVTLELGNERLLRRNREYQVKHSQLESIIREFDGGVDKEVLRRMIAI